MVEIRWMSLEGQFRAVAKTKAHSVSDAFELIKSVFAEAKLIDTDDDGLGDYRVTAKSLGGRSGRNVAFITPDEEAISEDLLDAGDLS